MRTVTRRPFLSYLFLERERKRKTRHFPFLFRQAPKLNPLSLSLFVSVCFIVGGTHSLLSLAAGFGLLFTLAFIYLHARASAQNLYVERSIRKPHYFEGEVAEVDLKVINTSVGHSVSFKVIDHFTPSHDEEVEFDFSEGLKAKTKVRKTYRRPCDGGLGIKTLGPLRIVVSDWFGLFFFDVIDDTAVKLEVLPKIESIPDWHLQGSMNSGVYGKYEVSQRGHSVQFRGIREYVRGDSLQHVAWKITAKNQEILVKEFDRMVNSQVYVAANEHPSLHMGKKSQSTWEVTRDVCLSLVSQQVEAGNSVQYIGNDWHFDLSESQCTFEMLVRKITAFEIDTMEHKTFTASRAEEHFVDLFRRVQSGSTLFYVTPYVDMIQEPLLKTMSSFLLNKVQPIVILVDLNSYLKEFSKDIDFKKGLFIPPTLRIYETLAQLQSRDIDCILLQADTPIADSFMRWKGTAA